MTFPKPIKETEEHKKARKALIRQMVRDGKGKLGTKKKVRGKKFYKDKANGVFSKYVRRYYAVDGFVSCYTCGISKPVKNMQAGHGIAGRSNAVLYMLEIVKPQCVGCNYFGKGQSKIFTRKLIEEMGVSEYEKLVLQSNQHVVYEIEDYQAIHDKYSELLKDL